MDISEISALFTKEFKTYEELKDLDSILLSLVETDSGFNKLSQQKRFKIINKLTLKIFYDQEIVFSKGDKSDCLYIILSGSLGMFNKSPNGFLMLEKKMTKGVVGERGILKNNNRSLSAVSIGTTLLLKLDALTFKKYLIGEFTANLLAKKNVVDKFIPGIDQFTDNQKEKLSYAINVEVYKKGKVLILQQQKTNFFMIIIEGECEMIVENGFRKRIVAILHNGSIIGEDSAFFNRPSCFTVIVTSELLKVASIKNADMKVLFPKTVISMITENSIKRNLARNKLVSFSNPSLLNKRKVVYKHPTIVPKFFSPKNLASNEKEKKILKNFSFSSMFFKID